jgi:hypothetical protein
MVSPRPWLSLNSAMLQRAKGRMLSVRPQEAKITLVQTMTLTLFDPRKVLATSVAKAGVRLLCPFSWDPITALAATFLQPAKWELNVYYKSFF